MHIFFSGIGGTGIGPLALIAKQAGFEVSGSDKQESQYTQYLLKHDVDLYIGQTHEAIESLNTSKPIDWYVYSSALPLEQPYHPELVFVKENNIKHSKRDKFLNALIIEKGLNLIAFAGTHGKTSSTAMAIWACKQLNVPISYSVGAKLSFGDMGAYNPDSEIFLYECDEFDNNFLTYHPFISVLSKVDWDHHEIFPNRDTYIEAFKKFCSQSNSVVAHTREIDYLNLKGSGIITIDNKITELVKIPGKHNRENAAGVITALMNSTHATLEELLESINSYPGSYRRFEKIANNIYTDYAHTPEEIESTIQLARETSNNLVVVYEPLTNRRQHFMKDMYKDVFKNLKSLYWVPSYLAREDPDLAIISPEEFVNTLDASANARVANIDEDLKSVILNHAANNNTVLLLAGGGGGSLDEWARNNLVA